MAGIRKVRSRIVSFLKESAAPVRLGVRTIAAACQVSVQTVEMVMVGIIHDGLAKRMEDTTYMACPCLFRDKPADWISAAQRRSREARDRKLRRQAALDEQRRLRKLEKEAIEAERRAALLQDREARHQAREAARLERQAARSARLVHLATQAPVVVAQPRQPLPPALRPKPAVVDPWTILRDRANRRPIMPPDTGIVRPLTDAQKMGCNAYVRVRES